MPTQESVRGASPFYEHSVSEIPGGSQALERLPLCPVCGGEEARPRYEIEASAIRLFVCADCGLGRLHPLPGLEELRDLYPDAYYGEPGSKFQPLAERLVRFVGERHISFLARAHEPGSSVLDVGCGRGVLLGALADRGFEVHGVELSEDAVRGAEPRAQIRIAPSLVEAGYPAESFDLVVVWHVLEHLQNPREALEEVHRILKPEGRLIVAVPNFSSLQARWTRGAWFHLDLPRHLYHFPLDGLRRLSEKTGFEIESEHHFSLRQNPFGWVQSLLNLSSRWPRNGLYTLMHRRAAGVPQDMSFVARCELWLLAALLTPLGLAATLCETWLRSGATVHIVARPVPGHSSR